jgi:hypothetical protein
MRQTKRTHYVIQPKVVRVRSDGEVGRTADNVRGLSPQLWVGEAKRSVMRLHPIERGLPSATGVDE